MLTTDILKSLVERYLDRTGKSPTQFGREALRDPNFVFDLRGGRKPNLETANKVLEFIGALKPERADA
jgi:hypothetical protein